MSFSFEQIAALKKGAVIWEGSQYGSLQVELLTDPSVTEVTGDSSHEGEKKVEFLAKVVNYEGGREINYLVNNRYMHYGPKLYTQNPYMTRAELDEWHEKHSTHSEDAE